VKQMTIFLITESHDDWHTFSTYITDSQKRYAEYMICAATFSTPNRLSRSIRVEIIRDKMLTTEMKDLYRKGNILLEEE
jgi:hypothetical protein